MKKKTITEKSIIIDKKNAGTSETQISLLSKKINHLSNHFKKNKNDKHSTMGLLKAVNRRKRLLMYLKRKNPTSYSQLISELNLRK